jgi:hypothetical protein
MTDKQPLSPLAAMAPWNLSDHGIDRADNGGHLSWEWVCDHDEWETETPVLTSRTIRPDTGRWHTWPRADYSAPCTAMTQQQCDEWAHRCGGVEGIGMSLAELEREQQGGMRIVTFAVVAFMVAACVLAVLTALGGTR